METNRSGMIRGVCKNNQHRMNSSVDGIFHFEGCSLQRVCTPQIDYSRCFVYEALRTERNHEVSTFCLQTKITNKNVPLLC